MYRDSELTQTAYKLNQVAKMLSVTPTTLRNWEKVGKVKFDRTPTNIRFLPRNKLIVLLDEQGLYYNDSNNQQKDIIYARVSSRSQEKYGDLDKQVSFIVTKIKDLQNVVILSEVGSGLNDKRNKLQQLIKMVMYNEVKRVFITDRDKLAQEGFHFLETVFNAKGVEVVEVKQNTEDLSV